MNVSDIIQIIAIIVGFITSFVAIVISILTLSQNNKMIRENSRANILFYIEHSSVAQKCNLVIKNFGNSMGRLEYIKITPKLEYEKCSTYKNGPKVLTESKNILLAPHQKISSFFDLINYKDEILNVELKYKTLGKTYIEKYVIDLSYTHSVATVLNEPKTDISAMKNITKGILEIAEKI